jgi:hypothetical protein
VYIHFVNQDAELGDIFLSVHEHAAVKNAAAARLLKATMAGRRVILTLASHSLEGIGTMPGHGEGGRSKTGFFDTFCSRFEAGFRGIVP